MNFDVGDRVRLTKSFDAFGAPEGMNTISTTKYEDLALALDAAIGLAVSAGWVGEYDEDMSIASAIGEYE